MLKHEPVRERFLNVKDCVFDLYGTLVDIRTDEESPALWKAMAAYYAQRGAVYTPKALQKAYCDLVGEKEAGLAASDTHEAHPEIRIEDVFGALFERAGIAASREEAVAAGLYFRKQSTAYIRLYPGAKELLLALRQAGKGVYLLSNAQAIFTRWEMDELELTECFDAVFLSSDYGCKKPHPRFYGALLDAHHIAPETAVMIGNDGRCDTLGAKQVGMKTVYIRSNISPKEALPDADVALEAMDLQKVKRILLGCS